MAEEADVMCERECNHPEAYRIVTRDWHGLDVGRRRLWWCLICGLSVGELETPLAKMQVSVGS